MGKVRPKFIFVCFVSMLTFLLTTTVVNAQPVVYQSGLNVFPFAGAAAGAQPINSPKFSRIDIPGGAYGGMMYVSELGGGDVVQVTPAGLVIPYTQPFGLFGGGASGIDINGVTADLPYPTQGGYPFGMFVGEVASVIVANLNWVNPGGLWGAWVNPGAFPGVACVEFDRTPGFAYGGFLHISDWGNDGSEGIMQILPGGGVVPFAPLPNTDPRYFTFDNRPGVSPYGANRLWVASCINGSVFSVTPGGAANPPLAVLQPGLEGLAFGHGDALFGSDLYAGNVATGTIHKIAPDGTTTLFADFGPALVGAAYLQFVTSGPYAIGGQPTLYVDDGVMSIWAITGTSTPETTKWVQMPDETKNGIDIRCDDSDGMQRIMADDFNCVTTGLITDVHFWGSWKYDIIGNISKIHLSIHSDIPAGQSPNGYSIPNEPNLWEMDFFHGDFNETFHGELTDPNFEWWWDPYTGLLLQQGDRQIYRYDIYIDPCDAFMQQGDPRHPVIYWLDISVSVDPCIPQPEFGWKTSYTHWNDDAVYRDNTEWFELRYPDLHPYYPESIDMAFMITTEPPEHPKQPVPHTKWSQPPIEIDPNSPIPTYCGWDEEAWRAYPSPAIWPIVADDFHCLGTMPVTSIHWWGSYIGWDGNEPPQSPSSGHEEWRIRFWSNVPAGMPVSFSWPEEMLWEIVIPEARVQIDRVGRDDSPRPQDPNETCFQYYVELDPCEVFWQDDFNDQTMNDIYWMSIEALDRDTIQPYHWGWKTRPWHWMDDAITMNVNDVTVPGVGATVDPILDSITPIEYDGNSFDVSFELDTDPNYIKWEQLFTGIRHWPHYEDELSMVTTRVKKWEQLPDPNWSGMHCHDLKSNGDHSWTTLADDWRCEGGLVTDLHWWGSYENRGSGIDHFHLSIHEPNVNSLNLPGPEVWGVDVPFSSLTEIDTGMVQSTGQRVYLYKYDLNEPFSQIEDANYWFDITAYSIDPCNPALWYWQEAGRNPVPILNPAVSGGGPGVDWTPLDWEPNYSEMAFAITSRAEVNEPNHHLVADDWLCLRRTPVIAIAWWGSYISYGYEACNRGFAPVPPDQFRLTMWTDSPVGSDPCYPYSHPDELIWEYNAAGYDEVLVGFDKKPHGGPHPNEPVFRYSVRLPETKWFHQPDYNEVFWLSVQAVYDVNNVPNYDWGWTNHKHVFNDDAVSGYYDDANEVWVWEELHDQTGKSADMSFILFTDPNVCSTCANYNTDWIINCIDYADFADDWYWVGPAGGYNNSDLNCDGIVDNKDLRVFVLQWLKFCP